MPVTIAAAVWLQVHLACAGGDIAKAGIPASKLGAPAGKPPPASAKPGAKGGTAGSTTAAVVLDEEGALRAVQAVISAKPADRALAEQMLRDAVAKVCISTVWRRLGLLSWALGDLILERVVLKT